MLSLPQLQAGTTATTATSAITVTTVSFVTTVAIIFDITTVNAVTTQGQSAQWPGRHQVHPRRGQAAGGGTARPAPPQGLPRDI